MESTVSLLIQNNNLLDNQDFNIIDYINFLLPTEQSLSLIDDIIIKLETDIQGLDGDIRHIIHEQPNVIKNGKGALYDAQKVIKKLFSHIQDIKDKAEKSEDIVKEITHDIKQLDYAKKNLTSSITALNHLHMLVSGIQQLKMLTKEKQYGEIILPLQATTQVMQNFKHFTDIIQIKELTNQVQQIHLELSKQITVDFKEAFLGQTPKKLQQLTDSCLVLSVLDPKVKKDLLAWFVTNQLQEYTHLFGENQDYAWLDKIDRRYAWFKKHLLDFEAKIGMIFPAQWNVSEEMALQFCHLTREQMSQLMLKRSNDIDVKTLMFAIQKTILFEVLLSKRFAHSSIENINNVEMTLEKSDNLKGNKSNPGSTAENTTQKSIFIHLIGRCFEPYMNIYIESLDHSLAELLANFATEIKHLPSKTNELHSEIKPVQPLPSCADLFVYYKKCILQCSQLSSSTIILSLSEIFQKYLREYAFNILQSNLPKVSNNAGLASTVSSFTRDFRDLSTSGFIQNLQIFSREGDGNRCNSEELDRICCILVTADYCLETVQSLEKKLREKTVKSCAHKINFAQEQDIFNGIISNCIQLLVHDLELACEPAFVGMTKIQWNLIQAVVDQSSYVGVAIHCLEEAIPGIRERLFAYRKYFTQLCIKFVSQLIPKLIQQIFKCRPISTIGTEQLLLDVHVIKSVLLKLPSLGSEVNKKPPSSYSNVVTKGMQTAEMILKITMTPNDSVENVVVQCRNLLPGLRAGEFQKILEMKGLKKSEQIQLMEEFKKIVNENQSTEEQGQNDANAFSLQTDSSGIKRLEKLIKKRL